MVSDALPYLPPVGSPVPGVGWSKEAARLRHSIHHTILEATEDVEKFGFNKMIARIRELTNVLKGVTMYDQETSWIVREGLETVIRLLGPVTPHVCEELWERLGHTTLLTDMSWPHADMSAIMDDTVTVAVQVNGKLRATLTLPKDSDRHTATEMALADPAVVRALGQEAVHKTIIVPNRIVNLVTSKREKV